MSVSTVLLFIAAMATLGFADFATKQTSGRISPALGTLIYAVTAAMPALIWTIWARAHAPLIVTRVGIMWSVWTGLAFGVFAGMLFRFGNGSEQLSLEAYQATFQHLLYGVGLAIVLTLLLRETGTAVRPSAPAEARP